jgi:hypothetical protein
VLPIGGRAESDTCDRYPQVRFRRDRVAVSPTGDLGYRGRRGAVGLGYRLTLHPPQVRGGSVMCKGLETPKAQLLTGFVQPQTKLLWNQNRPRGNLTSCLYPARRGCCCGRAPKTTRGARAARTSRAPRLPAPWASSRAGRCTRPWTTATWCTRRRMRGGTTRGSTPPSRASSGRWGLPLSPLWLTSPHHPKANPDEWVANRTTRIFFSARGDRGQGPLNERTPPAALQANCRTHRPIK